MGHAYKLRRERRGREELVRKRACEGDLCRTREDELGGGAGAGGGGVCRCDVICVVVLGGCLVRGVSGAEAAAVCDVGAYDVGGEDGGVAAARGDGEGVVGEGELEEGRFVLEEAPCVAGRRRAGFEVDEGELGGGFEVVSVWVWREEVGGWVGFVDDFGGGFGAEWGGGVCVVWDG